MNEFDEIEEETAVEEEPEEVIEMEPYEPVPQIEIEEGMPEEIKTAIAKFNKRTAVLNNIGKKASEATVYADTEEEYDNEYDDEVVDEETTTQSEDDSIIEEDNTDVIGDLF